jgi:hypothetical protein
MLGALALGLLAASPAAAATTAANPLGCAPTQDVSTPFTSFGDTNSYAAAPGGGFEFGTTLGWSLLGAAPVTGNEPYQVQSSRDAWSLRIADGGVATSAPMCVDETFPNFRFFARNLGSAKSTLAVDVLFLDSKGHIKSTKSGTLKASDTGWQLVNPMKIGVTFDRTALNQAAPIAFRFSTEGRGGDWRLDDLLVDPYRRS